MSATSNKLVLGVADVAEILGRTPRSVQHAVQRRADWLPPPFYMGKRLCWLPEDIEAHVVRLADRVVKARRVGRPHER